MEKDSCFKYKNMVDPVIICKLKAQKKITK